MMTIFHPLKLLNHNKIAQNKILMFRIHFQDLQLLRHHKIISVQTNNHSDRSSSNRSDKNNNPSKLKLLDNHSDRSSNSERKLLNNHSEDQISFKIRLLKLPEELLRQKPQGGSRQSHLLLDDPKRNLQGVLKLNLLDVPKQNPHPDVLKRLPQQGDLPHRPLHHVQDPHRIARQDYRINNRLLNGPVQIKLKQDYQVSHFSRFEINCPVLRKLTVFHPQLGTISNKMSI